MTLRDTKERLCCTRGFATALLPVLKRAHRNAKQHRKGGLREPSRQSCIHNLGNLGMMNPRTNIGLHFTDRGQEFGTDIH